MNILPIFCDLDDFCLFFEPRWQRRLLADGIKRRNKPGALSLSEVMTLLVIFHCSGYRDFKTFYTQYVMKHLAGAFPKLTSYNRFVDLQSEALTPLWAYLHTRFGHCTGIAFVDATTLAVFHNLRIPQHKVFWDSARRGQSSMGWFYGFKLHLVINDGGQLLGCYLTPGNVDGRPVPHLVRRLWGGLFWRQRLHQPNLSCAFAGARVAAGDETQEEHEEPLALALGQTAPEKAGID